MTLLSVLIPSYNYKNGLKKILDGFAKCNKSLLENIEIIIGDDSDKKILSSKELDLYNDSIPNFIYIYNKKNFYIEKNFKFTNFVESEKFVINVGKIAETENHHPDISFGWGYAKVKISTHAIKGLAESDFVLAAKIDKI